MSNNNNNFSRRRRGMRFKPKGGLGPNPQRTDRDASQARAEVVAEQGGDERLFEKRHHAEIERAENIAAGLPPQGAPEPAAPHAHDADKKDFREPHLDTPAVVEEEKFAPVAFKEQPKGLVESIKAAAANLVKKVQKLIRPEKKIHKEVVINAETLETRVAVTEDGKLEEFNIERTSEERLVGSIFKGKVRNLEDGLKAAFVDIGFEKNAFLHYWDIVPNQFDSGVEIVEREGKRRDKPKITQRDIPRLYPPGSEIIVQVTKGPISTKGPRITTNLVLPGRYLVLLPNSDQCGISRKIESQEERKRLKKILRELAIPDGMGVIMRTAGEGQQLRYFVRDHPELLEDARNVCDLCASVQAAIVDVLVTKTIRAARRNGVRCVTASGGVTCNRALRRELARACAREGFALHLADRALCTDNAAMIGILAERKLMRPGPPAPLDGEIQPGWILA